MTIVELSAYIDQSVLKPEFNLEDIKKYIKEGIDFKCKTVCINPSSLDIAIDLTKGTNTGVCVVCDFPFGTSTTASKVMQAEEYCKKGIFELDIVANYGWIRSGLWTEVESDIKAIVDVCHKYGTAVKVIFETDSFSVDKLESATEVAISAGTDFVKTSTGFLTGFESNGATPEIIQVMMDTAKGRCKIKGFWMYKNKRTFL